MISISLCMIVKDEEETLKRCLESAAGVADEIIIVDTGSADRTKTVAKAYTPHVLDFEWQDDFAAARNYAFSQATKDYIFWLDADDVLLPPDKEKLIALKRTLDPAVDAVSMDYHIARDKHGNPVTSIRRFRLVKRSRKYRWQGAVHEMLLVSGRIWNSDIAVTHKKERRMTDRNLQIYEKRLREGKPFSPQDLFHFARELHQFGRLEEAVEHYTAFLDRSGPSPENRICALQQLADCYHRLGQTDKEFSATFESFQYDIPRPESCCRLGYHFLQKDAYRQAVYWYKQALAFPVEPGSWVIVNQTSRTLLPHIQLALCYYRLGQYAESYYHNKQALTYSPDDPAILNNLLVLEQLLKDGKERTGAAAEEKAGD
ncbi:glycosyltransferase [Cohnella hongkongensis]|uniref:Glycosyltransferase n=1 Tax=Cohnella hongkongensis TaxID=178337 RepID=A0ABV9F843_9BACL